MERWLKEGDADGRCEFKLDDIGVGPDCSSGVTTYTPDLPHTPSEFSLLAANTTTKMDKNALTANIASSTFRKKLNISPKSPQSDTFLNRYTTLLSEGGFMNPRLHSQVEVLLPWMNSGLQWSKTGATTMEYQMFSTIATRHSQAAVTDVASVNQTLQVATIILKILTYNYNTVK